MISSENRKIFNYALLGVIFNGLSGVIAARSLGILQFSAFTAALAIITTLQIFFQGLQFSNTSRFDVESPEYQAKMDVKRFLTEGVATTIFVGTLIYIFRSELNVTPLQAFVISQIVFPGIALASVSGFLLAKNNFAGYQRVATVNAALRCALSAFLFILGSKFSILNSPAVFIGIIIVSTYFTIVIIRRDIPVEALIHSNISNWRTWRSVTAVSAGWLLVQGDLILFNAVLEPDQAGKVAAYSTFGKILISFVSLLGLTLSSRYTAKQSSKGLKELFLILCGACVLLTICAVITGDLVVRTLYGADYILPLNSLTLLIVSNAVWGVFSGLLFAQLKNKVSTKLSLSLIFLLMISILVCAIFPLTFQGVLTIATIAGIVGTIVLLRI